MPIETSEQKNIQQNQEFVSFFSSKKPLQQLYDHSCLFIYHARIEKDEESPNKTTEFVLKYVENFITRANGQPSDGKQVEKILNVHNKT